MNNTKNNKPQTKKIINTCKEYPDTTENRPRHNQQDVHNRKSQMENYLTTMTQQTWLGQEIWRHTQEIKNALDEQIKTGIILATTAIAIQAITAMGASRLTHHQKMGLEAIRIIITEIVIAAIVHAKRTRTSGTQQQNGEQNRNQKKNQ